MNETPQPIIIKPEQLPLYCAGSQTEAWNGHPRVFLPIQSFGTAECPYCGAVYQLDGEVKGHH